MMLSKTVLEAASNDEVKVLKRWSSVARKAALIAILMISCTCCGTMVWRARRSHVCCACWWSIVWRGTCGQFSRSVTELSFVLGFVRVSKLRGRAPFKFLRRNKGETFELTKSLSLVIDKIFNILETVGAKLGYRRKRTQIWRINN